jgi:thimet oligopeptidase
VLLCVSFAAPAAWSAAAAPLPPGFPVVDAAGIRARCDGELVQRRRELARMEHESGPGAVLREFDHVAVLTSNFDQPVSVLENAATDRETRDAAHACLEKLIPFGTELFQSAQLYARVKALEPHGEDEASYRSLLLEQFEDAGAALPPAARARAREIQDELNALALRFQRNLNEDATTVALTPAQVEGLPDSWLAARKRDAEGHVVVTLDYPSYIPFISHAVDPEARRLVWTAFQNRGGKPNLELLDRALALRFELAQLNGYPDYASFTLRRKMAGTPKAVSDFLASVKAAVDEGEAQELGELRQEKVALGRPDAGDPAQVRLERWDIAFLEQRARRARFKVDQEVLRAYFPTEASIRYVMRIAETLYGIRFVARDVPRWHRDVRYYEVVEAGASPGKAGTAIGAVYLDLFPREGKYGHAAAFGVRAGSALAGQRPVAALLANLDNKGLDQEELVTLVHEFGHVLHGVLSKARYADQSGTAVRLDFVEAPSQMFEEWGRREQPLRLFAQICPQCPRLDGAQLQQLEAAHRFGAGIRYAQQWLLAAYDLALHTGASKTALPAWEELEGATRLGYVPGTLFPAGFGHLMGGYEAGYYGYMWSEVLALDMLSAFHGNLLDPEVGRRYRKMILEAGGSRPPGELVERFLGRKPNADAFYAEITGRR